MNKPCRWTRKITRLSAPVCWLMASAAVGAADTSVHDRVKAQIEAALRAQEAANANHETGQQLARRLYAPDVALVGSGEPHIRHGIASAEKSVEAWRQSLGPDGQATCKFELEEPFVASETTASSFIILRCKAPSSASAQDSAIRMMYVWKLTAVGWRVALEIWEPGDR
jgi:hypothetical protein